MGECEGGGRGKEGGIFLFFNCYTITEIFSRRFSTSAQQTKQKSCTQ